MTENTFMLLMAVLIGLVSAVVAWCFKVLISLVFQLSQGQWPQALEPELSEQLSHYMTMASSSPLMLMLPLAVGGLLCGLVIHFGFPEAKGHGVPEIMSSVFNRGGVIKPKVGVAETITSALTVGTGGAAGTEGPIAQIGAVIGSWFGQSFKVNKNRLRTLVACGSAGGVAATFHAPMGGFMFAVEVILADFGLTKIAPILIAAVVAAVLSQYLFNIDASFAVLDFDFVFHFSGKDLWLYLLLGLVCGLFSFLFIKALYLTEDAFKKMKLPEALKPMVGGLLLGLSVWAIHSLSQEELGVQVLGLGYEWIHRVVSQGHGQTLTLSVGLLLAIGILKMIATSLTIGSGGSGGIFAPSLFMGAMLGAATAILFDADLIGGLGVVGMGAMVAGVTRAPITSILIIFEIADHQHTLIMPLMLACVVSSLLSRHLCKESIYSLKLVRRGESFKRGRPDNPLNHRSIQSVVSECVTIGHDCPFKQIVEVMSQHPNRVCFPVVNQSGLLVGTIGHQEIMSSIKDSDQLASLIIAMDIMRTDYPSLHFEDTLAQAMKLYAKGFVQEIPVTDHEGRVQGMILREQVLEIYNQEMFRQATSEVFVQSMSNMEDEGAVELAAGVQMAEFEVPEDFYGQPLKDLAIRSKYGLEVLMIKHAKQGKISLPSAGQNLIKGDVLVVIGETQNIQEAKRLFSS